MPTRLSYRRNLGPQIGPYGAFTTTGGGSTTAAICTDVFRSTELPTSHFAYDWLYWPSSAAPSLARITKTGLDPSAGTITLDRALGSSIGAGQGIELSARLPSDRGGADADDATVIRSLNDCLNEAARHILVRRTYSLPLVNNQHEYSLPVWLDRPGRLLDIWQPNATGTRTVSAADNGHPWELRGGASGVYVLHFRVPYRFSGGSHSLTLDVVSPADRYIKIGGTWTETTAGMTSDSDECMVEVKELNKVALALAYQTLRDTRSGADRAHYARLYQLQVPVARGAYGYDKDTDIDPSVTGEPVVEAA